MRPPRAWPVGRLSLDPCTTCSGQPPCGLPRQYGDPAAPGLPRGEHRVRRQPPAATRRRCAAGRATRWNRPRRRRQSDRRCARRRTPPRCARPRRAAPGCPPPGHAARSLRSRRALYRGSNGGRRSPGLRPVRNAAPEAAMQRDLHLGSLGARHLRWRRALRPRGHEDDRVRHLCAEGLRSELPVGGMHAQARRAVRVARGSPLPLLRGRPLGVLPPLVRMERQLRLLRLELSRVLTAAFSGPPRRSFPSSAARPRAAPRRRDRAGSPQRSRAAPSR